ncbi:MAG: hypothetical protein ABIB93_03595 [Chloroflexota bacterium]
MLNNEDIETLKQQLCPWLFARGIPVENFLRLSDNSKSLLHNVVCKPNHVSSPRQREDLYRELSPSERRNGKPASPRDDEVEQFFCPPSSEEEEKYKQYTYLSKF